MKKTLLIILIILAILIVVVIGFLMMSYPMTTPNTSPSANPNPSSTSGSSSKTYNINIQGFAFSPSLLTIKKGDKVIWTNKDSMAHTITSDSGSELDSATLSNGASYSHTFATAGTYNYHCTIHQSMKGEIIVQ